MALLAEDDRLRLFCEAVVRRLAREAAREVAIRPFVIGGCRFNVLQRELELARRDADVIVVAADAGRATPRRKPRWKRKAQDLREALGPSSDGVSLAVPEPCVEAWLLRNLSAVAAGLGSATGQRFRAPGTTPRFRKEREAKRALGSALHEMTGQRVAQLGFEFSEEIVAAMDLLDSPAEDLREWARDLERRLTNPLPAPPPP